MRRMILERLSLLFRIKISGENIWHYISETETGCIKITPIAVDNALQGC